MKDEFKSQNIYLSIGPELSCDKICHKIQKLLQKYPDATGKILKISIQTISSEDHEVIAKLEYRPN